MSSTGNLPLGLKSPIQLMPLIGIRMDSVFSEAPRVTAAVQGAAYKAATYIPGMVISLATHRASLLP
jgi:hypothetical protein